MALMWRESLLPFGVNLNNVHSLQLLEDVTGNATAAFAEVRWATAVSLAATIDSTESTNSKTSPQVYLPCHRCCHHKNSIVFFRTLFIWVLRNKAETRSKTVYQLWCNTNRDHKGQAPSIYRSSQCLSMREARSAWQNNRQLRYVPKIKHKQQTITLRIESSQVKKKQKE